jgi:hypothetical protein
MSGIGFNNGVAAKIGNSLFKQSYVVLESADTGVTGRTEKRAHAPRYMRMVHGEMNGTAVALAAGRLVADGTETVLGGEHGVVVMDSDAVFPYGAVADKFFSGKPLLEQVFHFWKSLEVWYKFGELASRAGMFLARMKMGCHSSDIEHLAAVAARFELPATGTQADLATNSIYLCARRLWALFRTGFAFPLDPVRTCGVRVKLCSWCDVLTSRAKFIAGSDWREFVANCLPVTAQFTRYGFLSAEAALDGSFA